MNISFITKAVNTVAIASISLMPVANVNADSAKLFWSGNSHYYQRFDLDRISWASAKSKCEALGAHLATTINVNEQGFVEANFLNPAGGSLEFYHLGGTYVAGKWTWITGEAWSYENWDSFSHASGNLIVQNSSGLWVNDTTFNFPYYKGYICEWSGNNFLGSAVVSDINGNGASEFAVLYQDAKSGFHNVLVKDSATQMLLNRLTFPGGTKASNGLVSLRNIQTSNTTPEIGVLLNTTVGIVLQIKDIKNNLAIIDSIRFLDKSYQARTITAVPDINGNGADEIVVMGTNINGKAKMEMRDSKTKAILRTVLY